ncbi:Uncharacterised protein [Canicola haemoglobinophilus]|uniref:Uncharacterized protein n=1 Tax=Canicola haemoglobinophilus TaxID=733 RepID=A0AB38HDF3_9PAST|nr:hypothetical protein [Canicola haemoglobinophilus]STO55090.1 Uncharacterised protein [Canicola haemoglobinophilus]STO69339.1 Uncharacterised protein [Canicola haemoglobinophilus]
MATTSFSRNFVIADDKEVDKLIHSLENPTKVVLEKRDLAEEKRRKEKILSKLNEFIGSLTP